MLVRERVLWMVLLAQQHFYIAAIDDEELQ
jgi:hypothetical protein